MYMRGKGVEKSLSNKAIKYNGLIKELLILKMPDIKDKYSGKELWKMCYTQENNESFVFFLRFQIQFELKIDKDVFNCKERWQSGRMRWFAKPVKG